MALSTVRAELAVVDIIRPVAVRALATQLLLGGQGTPVAAFTRDVRVRTVQRKIRSGIVVEMPLLPVDRVVAGRADFSEAPLVLVVVPVAVDALLGCIAEHMSLVAVGALGFGVLAEQRETRQTMVEKDIVFPGALVVTVCANVTLRKLVRIIVLVTCEAGGFQFDLEYRL